MRIAALLVLSALPLLSQSLFQQQFHDSTSGWMAAGSPNAVLRLADDRDNLASGAKTLELEYETSPTAPGMAVLPLPHTAGGANLFRLSLMVDTPSAIAFVLVEKNEARYVAINWVEPLEWKTLEFHPEDFILGDRAQDPPDPDGKLDLDQVKAVAVLDLSQVLSGFQYFAPLAVDAHAGTHKLWIRSFEISTAATHATSRPAPFLIDDFHSPQPSWFTLGAVTLKNEANTLRATYVQTGGKIMTLMRLMPPGVNLASATHLSFDIGSTKNAFLVVWLEEKLPGKDSGPRYKANLEVHAGKTEHQELALSGFEFEKNGPKDPNGKLNPESLKSISILDLTGAFAPDNAINTLTIGKIEAISAPATSQK